MPVFSNKLIKKCREQGLTIEEYHFCTLVDLGFSNSDSYVLSHQPATANPSKIKDAMNKVLTSQPVKVYLTYLAKVKAYEESEKTRRENDFRKKTEDELRAFYGMTAQSGEPQQTTPVMPMSDGSPRTKEDIIRELNAALIVETDPKIRLDYYKQLIDLQGMKREQEKEDDNIIHYYFPVTCKMCGLLQKAESDRARTIEKEEADYNPNIEENT